MKLADYRTIWIDLTDFIDWQGHFTGIQRVEYELASRFSKLSNVKFFYYHPIKSAFVEVGFDGIEQKAKIASGEIKLSKKEMTKQVRLSKRFMKQMKEAIPHDTRMKLVKIKGRIRRINEKNPFEPTHPFTSADIVLVLGGNWAFSTFMPVLNKVKNAVKGLKSVHVLYDFIPVMQPGFFPEAMEESYALYMKKLLQTSDLNLSISEYTKKDALKYAKVNNITPKKIVPFRLGDDFVKIATEKPSRVKVSNNEFIFCVGTFEVRKNHQLIYYMLKLAQQKGIVVPKIIIVGKKGWLSDSTLHLFKNDPDIKNQVTILHSCSDKEMAWLFENCLFTVYPSYYEGWGLPIAESLGYGKMCLSSNTSSMPEVAKNLIEYYSPFDTNGLLELIIKYLQPTALKKANDTVRKEYKTTTWDDTYNNVVKILETSL